MGKLNGMKGGWKMLKIKNLEDPLDESLIEDMLWNYIHIPTNMIEVEDSTENIWFGGYLVGYEVSKIFHDFKTKEDTEVYKTSYNLILSDGAGFPLAEQSEIFIITEDEFIQMLAEYVMDGVENATYNGAWRGENQETLRGEEESSKKSST